MSEVPKLYQFDEVIQTNESLAAKLRAVYDARKDGQCLLDWRVRVVLGNWFSAPHSLADDHLDGAGVGIQFSREDRSAVATLIIEEVKRRDLSPHFNRWYESVGRELLQTFYAEAIRKRRVETRIVAKAMGVQRDTGSDAKVATMRERQQLAKLHAENESLATMQRRIGTFAYQVGSSFALLQKICFWTLLLVIVCWTLAALATDGWCILISLAPALLAFAGLCSFGFFRRMSNAITHLIVPFAMLAALVFFGYGAYAVLRSTIYSDWRVRADAATAVLVWILELMCLKITVISWSIVTVRSQLCVIDAHRRSSPSSSSSLQQQPLRDKKR